MIVVRGMCLRKDSDTPHRTAVLTHLFIPPGWLVDEVGQVSERSLSHAGEYILSAAAFSRPGA
jgi:hypothetical protein